MEIKAHCAPLVKGVRSRKGRARHSGPPLFTGAGVC
jgi:hypothetical protein